MRVFLAIMVILLILLLIFAVQNPGSTEVTFLTFSSTVSLLLIILVSAAVGLLLGLAVMLPGNLRRSSRVRKLESEAWKVRSQTDDRLSALEKSRSERADAERADSERMDAERTHSKGDASAKES